jgi:precorrin-3B synthase
LQRWQLAKSTNEEPISPLEGEMSGRTEGGETGGRRIPYTGTPLTDGRFAVPVALPFGHSHAKAFIELARSVEKLGAEIRLAPKRTLLLLTPSQAAAHNVRDTARRLGFIVDAADPRSGIAACPGAPACASGHIGARALAAEIAANMPAGTSLDLHVSGCEKRCAKPGHDGLTLLGRPDGVALVLGKADAAPIATVGHDHALVAIQRVAGLIAAERTLGEAEPACVARIGPARLADAFASAATSKDTR